MIFNPYGRTLYIDINQTEILAIANESLESKAAEKILEWGCEIVVVTGGSKGSNGYRKINDDMIIEHSDSLTLQKSQIIDGTGAGDAYVGGFLVSWLHDRNLGQAMRAGSLCGATAVCCFGGSSTDVEVMKSFDDVYA